MLTKKGLVKETGKSGVNKEEMVSSLSPKDSSQEQIPGTIDDQLSSLFKKFIVEGEAKKLTDENQLPSEPTPFPQSIVTLLKDSTGSGMMVDLNLCNIVIPSCLNKIQSMVFGSRMFKTFEEMLSCQRAEIMGSPGAGKSTVSWMFVTLYQKYEPTKVCTWVNLKMSIRIVIHGHKYFVEKIGNDNTNFEKVMIPNSIDEGHEKCTVDLIVFDGITANTTPRMMQSVAAVYSHKGVESVSSVFIVTSLQSSKVFQGFAVKAIHVDPWSLNDYFYMCQNSPTLKDWVLEFFQRDLYIPERERLGLESADNRLSFLLQRKFYYAGGNARWMFDLTIAEIMEDVRRAVEFANDDTVFFDLQVGTAGMDAVNRLVCSLPTGERIFASDYIIRFLLHQNPLDRQLQSFIRFVNATNDIRPNPALNGWVFEIDFVHHVLNNLGGLAKYFFMYEGTVKQPSVLRVHKVTIFEKDELEEEMFTRPLLEADNWFIPRTFNQGGFDAVHLVHVKNHQFSFRFYQIARGKKHDLKIHFMDHFLECFIQSMEKHIEAPFRIEIVSYEIIFITGENNEDFVLPAVVQSKYALRSGQREKIPARAHKAYWQSTLKDSV
jgi:hypothetical protein